MAGKKRIAVLASGRGSNFQAVLDAMRDGRIRATCVGLITDNPKAYAAERARAADIPVTTVDYSRFASREEYEKALLRELVSCNPDLLVLAGYMRIVGREIVKEFNGRMINIHPALLPSFPGLHGQRQALEHGVKVAGCTVHFVDENLDGGPIIVQKCVPVLEGDDEEALAARILEQEHRCLPEAIRLFCEGRLSIVGRRVIIR
ncbi:MAG TPA: phosphoribosylglycinamide formyltransferase [Methanoregulaceae archaeon]|nr:phosphoribosylglycinamide formyltransferase [Methanoregulaceae archaeon]HRY74849.1 phosphoribosylglycinamide formyltransferase [Methanoregulaceae archaeon]